MSSFVLQDMVITSASGLVRSLLYLAGLTYHRGLLIFRRLLAIELMVRYATTQEDNPQNEVTGALVNLTLNHLDGCRLIPRSFIFCH